MNIEIAMQISQILLKYESSSSRAKCQKAIVGEVPREKVVYLHAWQEAMNEKLLCTVTADTLSFLIVNFL